MLVAVGVFSLVLSLSSPNCEVPMVFQLPELPTGCEAVSTVMLLNNYNFDISKSDFTSEYVYYDYVRSADMYEKYFFGNPFSNYGSYCNPSVCEDAVSGYFSDIHESSLKPENLSGYSFDHVLGLVSLGIPVAVWVTPDYDEPEVRYNEFGIKVYRGSHCVVITGYFKDKIFINDPLHGKLELEYSRLKELYDIMDRRALSIYEKYN